MAEPNVPGKISLTLYLSADLAKRLQLAAEAQKRAATDVATELLDRHLPRVQVGKASKGNIPYA
jgi:hypothetical protein